MRKFTLLSFALIAFIGLSAQNLVQNGGFESWKADGTPENWMGVKTTIDSSNVSKSTDAYEGTASVKLVNNSTSHKRFNTDSIEVKAGTTYQISFVVKGVGNIRTNIYDKRSTGSGYGTYNPYVKADTAWTVYTQNVTAANSTTGAEFIFSVQSTDTVGILLDSVSIIELANGADIMTFVLAEEISPAMIDTESAQVTSTVAWDTDLSALTPEITVSTGAQVSPTTGTTLDFSAPVKYIVTAQDGTKKAWSVAVINGQKPIEASIYDIQYTKDASGDSPLKDSLVSTTGVVVAKDKSGLYIQDGAGAWNGIYIYGSTDPVEGDSVSVMGQVQEYNGETEISGKPTVTILNSGNTMADPTEVSVADFNTEQYESVLVKLTDVECATFDGSNTWKVVQSSSTSDTLVVYNKMYAYTPTVGEVYTSLMGISAQYKTMFELYPRSADDIVVKVGISEDQLAAVSIYPNPVSNVLNVTNLDGISKITISNILGQAMMTKEVSSTQMSISTSGMKSGIYIITLTSETGLSRSERFIKE